MSFGPRSETKAAMGGLQDIAGKSLGSGSELIPQGQQNMQQAANFFKSILGGNQANTAATLAPDVQRIRDANQGTLQAVSTLTPRGGGRFATLFAQPFQQQQQVQNLFNGVRSAAAPQLAGIGGQQGNLGANLFQIGTSANSNLGELGQRQQQISQQGWQSLGSGLFNLATMPLGGFGGTLAGKIGGKLGGMF